MTTPDLIAALLRLADIAGTTVRAGVYREAADRLTRLVPAAEQARMAIALHSGCSTDRRLLAAMGALDDALSPPQGVEADAR